MTDYNWCHGSRCHTIATQSRVRGSADNKVLRTIKIKVYHPSDSRMWNYFCNQNCLHTFIQKHLQEILKIEPRSKALETPIKIEKTKYENYRMRYNGNGYDKVPYTSTRTTIKILDND